MLANERDSSEYWLMNWPHCCRHCIAINQCWSNIREGHWYGIL